METQVLLAILAIPALILCNAFFVAAEFALVALRKTRVEEMVQQKLRGAKSVEFAHENMDRSIAACQLGITLTSIAIGAVGEPAFAHLVEPYFTFLPDRAELITRHGVAIILALFGITVLHVILGEQVPKLAALQTADRTALWVARPLNIFARLSSPLLKLMNAVSSSILRLLGYKAGRENESVHSIEELRLLIDDVEDAGVLDEDQADFVQNVFMLSRKTVRECMVPREKVAALEIHTPPDKILEAVRTGAHTRMPVYDNDLDHIVGIVNTKDLFHILSLRGLVVLEDALYPAVYLEPDITIDDALRLFKKSRRPMALVRDDQDKIIGLLTLEDVIEEIVGDIEDEHDRPVPRRSLRRGKRKPRPQAVSERSEKSGTPPAPGGSPPDETR